MGSEMCIRDRACIDAIAQTPGQLRSAIAGLDERALSRRYREGGWTIREVVHHVPDSHMHAYVRFKFALTEDAPSIKAYDEQRWALLPDVTLVAPDVSVNLLDALHQRWVALLRRLTEDQFRRRYLHPELGPVALYEALALYAWHGRHHTAHVRQALESSL